MMQEHVQQCYADIRKKKSLQKSPQNNNGNLKTFITFFTKQRLSYPCDNNFSNLLLCKEKVCTKNTAADKYYGLSRFTQSGDHVEKPLQPFVKEI